MCVRLEQALPTTWSDQTSFRTVLVVENTVEAANVVVSVDSVVLLPIVVLFAAIYCSDVATDAALDGAIDGMVDATTGAIADVLVPSAFVVRGWPTSDPVLKLVDPGTEDAIRLCKLSSGCTTGRLRGPPSVRPSAKHTYSAVPGSTSIECSGLSKPTMATKMIAKISQRHCLVLDDLETAMVLESVAG